MAEGGGRDGTLPLVLFRYWPPRRRRARTACTTRFQRLSALKLPVFVANGDRDPMILPHYSYLLAGLIPQARVKIYPDAAHGFLFQHHTEFAADVGSFLDPAG
jgi:pimeloyl-ACP methyl ester carboxylesterase